MQVPVSAIIPTYNRSEVLLATLQSIADQNTHPDEIIIIDASNDTSTKEILNGIKNLESEIRWEKADEKGAAAQRNQGVILAKQEFIMFMDDDIILEENCIERLWNAINKNENIGGVNAMITNQKYNVPGKITLFMFQLMKDIKFNNYAGKCIGPAWNILPSDADELPDINEVDWLNTTCTLYRKQNLPNPAFSSHFKGYSIFEDLALSLIVGKNSKLLNIKNAKIFHDSQIGEYKKNHFKMSKMELVNRYFVMKYIMGKNTFKDYGKLFILEVFQIISRYKAIKIIPMIVFGKIAGFFEILFFKIADDYQQ